MYTVSQLTLIYQLGIADPLAVSQGYCKASLLRVASDLHHIHLGKNDLFVTAAVD